MPKHIHPVVTFAKSGSTKLRGDVTLSEGSNITLTQSGQDIQISAAAGGGGAAVAMGMSSIGNTAGTTGTVDRQLLVVGGPNITASQSINGSSATVSVSGGPHQTASHWHLPYGPPSVNQAAPANASWYWHPFNLPVALSGSRAEVVLSVSTASQSSAAISLRIALYSRTNSTQLSMASSASQTYSWTSGTNSSTNWGGYSALRKFSVPLSVNATPGDWYYAINLQTTNAGTYSMMAASFGGNIIGFAGSTDHTSQGYYLPFVGRYTASSTDAPATVAQSNLLSDAADRMQPRFLVITNIG